MTHKQPKAAIQPVAAEVQTVFDRQVGPPGLADGVHTAYAGMFFLIHVMINLGMTPFLQAYPHELEAELPQRLFQAIGQSQDAPADDPVMNMLPIQDDGTRYLDAVFVAPERWQQTICQPPPWRLQRMPGRPGARVLCDRSGRLPVVLWSGRTSEAVRHFLADNRLQVHAPWAHAPDADIALRAWHIAMRRWCRRYAGLGLYNIVCRPGRVSATRTHVDIFLHHQQTDIRVRRAGLDLNPGWIPWIGRVVSFHYLDDEAFIV